MKCGNKECDDYDATYINNCGVYRGPHPEQACKHHKALIEKTADGSKVPCSVGLCATTQADLRGEILDRMNYFYLQTDGTYKWPNNAEGDLLKMAHKLISA